MSLIDKTALAGYGSDAQQLAAASATTSIVERQTGRFFGRKIWSISVQSGGVTTIQCPAHGLIPGMQVVISGSNCTPTLDGTRTVLTTGLTRDTFQVTLGVTEAGTAGVLAKIVREAVEERNYNQMMCLGSTPVQSVTSIKLGDYTVDSTTYALDLRNDGLCWSGIVDTSKIGLGPRIISYGLSGRRMNRIYDVIYVAGCYYLPADLEAAAVVISQVLMKSGLANKAVQSESIEDYSYSLASAEMLRHLPTNISSVLASYRSVA